ncbi:hypothetical protein [Halobacillus seohaensis]|uniref:Uncharacterized protein n=1 Tax=Halobacillus seohaensis TaxID=447421 RepID=A0ABW2EJ53_9BACI
MQSIKLNKVFHLENNNEINFSRGLLLIDDQGSLDNWRVSLTKVQDTHVFMEDYKSENEFRLNLLDFDGNSYIGSLAVDMISANTTVLMVSKGELNGE